MISGGLANGVMVVAALPRKEDADLAFLGPHLPDDVAQAIAEGTVPRHCMLFYPCKESTLDYMPYVVSQQRTQHHLSSQQAAHGVMLAAH